MSKFLILFIGGVIPEHKFEKSVTDRLSWMQKLRDQNKFVDGSPLSPIGKVLVSQNNVKEYEHNHDSINGFITITADDIEEAVAIAKEAPQARPEFGNWNIEIRQLQPLV